MHVCDSSITCTCSHGPKGGVVLDMYLRHGPEGGVVLDMCS